MATLPNPIAFTQEEAALVQLQLDGLIRSLRHVPGGGKMEEGYWSNIYHSIKGADPREWSNLPFRDFAHNGVGVETKILGHDKPSQAQGRRLMHPSATRTITFDPSAPAEVCKVQILEQFGAQIADFRRWAAEQSGTPSAEIRWGVLLWSPKLEEFLYFEEYMVEPDSAAYTAEFVERRHRKTMSRTLGIFERDTGVKRYSVTMPDKGAKVQPYFDVPLIGQGAHVFTVPLDDRKPLWLSEETINRIEAAAGGDDVDAYLRRLLGL